ncbi:hypothetical protein [Roseomonas marmotae]|uniref:DUF2589 domain-containing protein n=1 Tax=Roseomonas marmotae TaxID=2768161 RepID=A0ABS3KAK9_9PROT|nr:hypothetical protein [Roseomonas marmotae]MBO1074486.1 hypothetical protein [Roseomonas marmotae]QTI78218.1 hypothetical protein IAI58_10910 [Roseomonas marmotae]
MPDQPTVFADGILDANVNFGVARLTLVQTKPDGTPAPCGQLIIPVVQLPTFTNGMVTLLKQIESKMKQAQQEAAAPASDAQPIPGAFRFSGS